MITYHVERLADMLEELKPLFIPHHAELGVEKDRMPLDPQYDLYLAREALGEVLCVTMRDKGRIGGYFVGFVAPGMHYKSTLTLTMDILWLHPDYRGGDSLESLMELMALKDLMATVKAEAQRRGVKIAYLGSKLHKDISELLEESGGVATDKYFRFWWGE